MIKDHQMVVFKWVVTYTACPLGKLTRMTLNLVQSSRQIQH